MLMFYRIFSLNFCGILLCLSFTESKNVNHDSLSPDQKLHRVERSPNSYNYDVFYSSNGNTEVRSPPEHIISSKVSGSDGTKRPVETSAPQPQRASDGEEELMVRTKNGFVKGRTFDTTHIIPKYHRNNQTAPPRKLNAWLGIPYAEKPLGDLRFKRPVPIRNWRGVYHATKLQNTCFQNPDKIYPGFWGTELWNPNTPVSEDCLYLNVWTTNPRPKKPVPVMLWIYGGSFLSGTSTLEIYDPKAIVAETEVVFVSLNYRVSIFGFLFLDHENAPGNMGLLDQNMAIKWVSDNIAAFGGDPAKITLVGESAGSASVSFHLLSPLSQNLFKSAIMQSGGFLADWATLEKKTAIKRYTETLQHMGCNGTAPQLIECAKRLNPQHVLDSSDEYFFSRADHGIMQFPFLPVVDNYFLEGEPIELVNRGKVKKCPIMLGVNKDEANWFYIYAFPEYRDLKTEPKLTYDLYRTFLHSLFHYYPQFPTTANKKVIDAITYRYTYWDNVHNRAKNIENLDDAAADFHFICPALDMASTFAMNNQDVFFYHFTQRASNHLWPDYFGVLHADEIQFTFGQPLYERFNFTSKERIFTRKLMKYWSNFVRYDNPNGLRNNILNVSTPTMKTYIEPWPKYRVLFDAKNDRQKAFLELNADKNRIGYNLRADYCSFWGSYLPKLLLDDADSKCECEDCSRTATTVSSGSSSIFNLKFLPGTFLAAFYMTKAWYL